MCITSVNVISQISMNGNKIDNTINGYMKSTNDFLLITKMGKMIIQSCKFMNYNLSCESAKLNNSNGYMKIH